VGFIIFTVFACAIAARDIIYCILLEFVCLRTMFRLRRGFTSSLCRYGHTKRIATLVPSLKNRFYGCTPRRQERCSCQK
ncbi:hypothetical protein, partial [Bacteroides stercoris]|uniref:hypothetical protein n=1 Tax=Bacteroides stercoris TaxID=46506 RepID=UPI001C6FEA01